MSAVRVQEPIGDYKYLYWVVIDLMLACRKCATPILAGDHETLVRSDVTSNEYVS